MLYINSNEKFQEVIDEISNEDMIGIDTEFVRRDTYYAKLSLVQVSTATKIFIIDPLSVDISLMKNILLDKKIIKIFHAPNQDLGIFHHLLKIETTNIFDTQEAVKFLGLRNQISYQDVCSQILGIQIEKTQQFREWNVRPLPDDMIEYAGQDVLHLIPLYHSLKKLMEEKKIFINFCRYMESFSQKEFYEVKLDEIWKKVRTTEKSTSFLRKLQIIASFRETCAIQLDMPRSFVISDHDIVQITKTLPTNSKELVQLKIRSPLNQSQLNSLFDLCAGLRT